MPTSRILVDSSFLYALYDRTDDRHRDVDAVADIYTGMFLIPYVILTETAFLFKRAGGTVAVASFLDALVKGQFQYEIVSSADLNRASEIMLNYLDARLDFVDCCIMALSERLNITQVCTLDQRDFSIFRPKHCDYLELLP